MPGGERAGSAAELVWALISGANSSLLEAELAHALRRSLSPQPLSPSQRRLADLTLLRRLINENDGAHPQRKVYDEQRRGATAPTSHTLLARYGSWWEACSIAARMFQDGKLPPGATFSGGAHHRGRRGQEPYTLDELVGTVRLCAFTLGRRPTWTDYARWSRTLRSRARRSVMDARLPSASVLYRLVSGPTPWATLLARAAIADRELQTARAALLDVPADDEAAPFLLLPLSAAARLAAELGGSLDWLAGRTSEPSPTADPRCRFDSNTFHDLRSRARLEPERIRRAAGLTIGQSRRLLAGTYKPTLGQLVDLASLLGVTAADLCVTTS